MYKYGKPTRIRKKWKGIICLLFFCFMIFQAKSSAFAWEEGQTVKVGFFELPGFQEMDEQGNPRGYNIDYLLHISDHTGIKYKFVKSYSWPEALKMLKEGKIDILAPSQKTAEREEEFDFSEYSFGIEYGSILTLDTNYDLYYEDYENFSNIKFGCVESLVFKDAFFEYAKANGFKPQVTFYKDTNALLSALNIGEVDAVVANLMIAKKNMKVLGKFSPGHFHYMVNKINNELLKLIDESMLHFKLVHPQMESNLTDKYFPFYNAVFFSKEELEYIENAPVFTVGCDAYQDPVSYIDSKTGELSGITIDILNKISEKSGLKFKYVPLPKGEVTYEYLRSNKIQLVSSVEYNSVNAVVNGLKLTKPYLSTRKVMVGKETKIDKEGDLNISLISGSQTIEEIILARYPNAKIKRYNTNEECFNAVISGKVDVTILNQYVAERFLHKPIYEDLIVVPIEGVEDEMSLSPIIYQDGKEKKDPLLADHRLLSIINKSIDDMSESEINDIIVQHTLSKPYKVTAADFFYQYKYFVLAIAAAIVSILGIGSYAYIQKVKSTKILILSEDRLKNITNNINGGVVVFLSNQGLKITFANEGFLSLIQYDKEEYNKLQETNYITYVHPEDIDALNQIIDNKTNSEQHISIHLRLLRKDGSYIPTLFNGTRVESHEKGVELYCVIMDISEQIKMMEKLEREQLRYQILVEKSDSLIFGVDFETKEITISHKFESNFGWTLPKSFTKMNVAFALSIWHVHEDDKKLLQQSIHDVLISEIDTECKVRLKKNDLTYRWCSISHNIMKKNGMCTAVIGMVTDINDEMMEKEKLLQQTQTDILTGLYNKAAFQSLSRKYFSEMKNENAAVIFMDLDNFKMINDVLGHMIGDKVIVETAKKLQIIFSQYDLLSRFGGDEFCILVKNIPYHTLCDKLNWTVEKMNNTYTNENQSVQVTASLGAALVPQQGKKLEHLLYCADKALYEAKRLGKNRYVIYDESLTTQEEQKE